MYRRYYQGYDPSDQNPQRPISEDREAEEQNNYGMLQNETNTKENERPIEPEIIVPEKPVQFNQTNKKLFPSLPLFKNPIINKDGTNTLKNIFANFGKDDLILLALIIIFMMDGVDDNLLLLVLVFLFFTGLST